MTNPWSGSFEPPERCPEPAQDGSQCTRYEGHSGDHFPTGSCPHSWGGRCGCDDERHTP